MKSREPQVMTLARQVRASCNILLGIGFITPVEIARLSGQQLSLGSRKVR